MPSFYVHIDTDELLEEVSDKELLHEVKYRKLSELDSFDSEDLYFLAELCDRQIDVQRKGGNIAEAARFEHYRNIFAGLR